MPDLSPRSITPPGTARSVLGRAMEKNALKFLKFELYNPGQPSVNLAADCKREIAPQSLKTWLDRAASELDPEHRFSNADARRGFEEDRKAYKIQNLGIDYMCIDDLMRRVSALTTVELCFFNNKTVVIDTIWILSFLPGGSEISEIIEFCGECGECDAMERHRMTRELLGVVSSSADGGGAAAAPEVSPSSSPPSSSPPSLSTRQQDS